MALEKTMKHFVYLVVEKVSKYKRHFIKRIYHIPYVKYVSLELYNERKIRFIFSLQAVTL